MLKVAIMGHGTVGSGVYDVFAQNAAQITRAVGEQVEVKYVLDLRDFSNLPYADKFVTDFAVIENDPEICVIAEVMGGVGAAYEFTKRCLKAGKSVCTSNKELVATHGEELLALAKEHNVNYLFEASVGGGIPLIRPMMQCLAANQIEEICGILNGTTNYILSQMIHNGVAFDAALKQAQQMGYAENDPTADIDGHDACRKICILSDLAFGDKIDPNAVSCQGIRGITLGDVAAADELGYVIKLIGRAKRTESGKIFAFVAPHLVPKTNPLACVEDGHLSWRARRRAAPRTLPGRGPGRPVAPLFALAPDGVYQAAASPRRWWSLTPPFQLFPLRRTVGGSLLFCGTFRRVAPPGR